MNKKKKLFLELGIIITIIASIVVIAYIFFELTKIKPSESTSNEIQNYSQNKYVRVQKNINDAKIYNFPEQAHILKDSEYYLYITATDNLIKKIDEEINIYYGLVLNDDYTKRLDSKKINNFCNDYNDITNAYSLRCTKKGNNLTIKNTYYLEEIFEDTINTKNYKIPVQIKKDTRLNEYLEELDKNNVFYQVINNYE